MRHYERLIALILTFTLLATTHAIAEDLVVAQDETRIAQARSTAKRRAVARTTANESWVLLGTVRVGRYVEKDSLGLPDDAPDVTAVRIVAKGGRVVLSRVQIAWADGSVHTEDRTINLLDGERTRPMAAGGTGRQPLHIGMLYAMREPGPGGIVLEAWGLKSARATPAVAAAADRGPEVGLATQRPRLGRTLEPLRLDISPARLDRISIRVADGDAHIESVLVTYEDGALQKLSIDASVPSGTSTSWLELDGARAVKSVEITPGERTDARQTPAFTLMGRPASTAERRKADASRRYEYSAPRAASRGVEESRASPPVARSVASAAPAASCITQTQCTPVPIFFGTSRVRKAGVQEITFTHDRGNDLVLGRATVTVPRAYRKKGEIPRPSWWDLARLRNPWREDPARHFTVLAGATVIFTTTEAFLADVMKAVASGGTYKDQAFVFVHGFNVSFEEALYRAAQIGYDLGQEDEPFGTAFVFSWPSAGETYGYAYDKDSSRLAVPHLRKFLELVVARSGAKKVHLVAHSMGNAALLAAMEDVVRNDEIRQRIGEVILAAPDVDAKEFEAIAARILPSTRPWTLYASSSDRAMVASREVHVGAPRAGDLINGRPVTIKNLDAIDVSAVSTSIFALNHNVYADRKELLNDMRRLMLTSERPPDLRDLSIRRIDDQAGTYWRYIQ